MSDDIVRVPLARLTEWSPFEACCWRGLGQPITRAEVAMAIADGRLEAKRARYDWTREKHIERVAYLIVNPDSCPIEIDVGVPCLNFYVSWIVTDGNHRLAAAFYRGDETIAASVAGQVDYAEEILGIEMPKGSPL